MVSTVRKFGNTKTDVFSNITFKSKRKPIFIETDDGKQFLNKHLKSNDIKIISRYMDTGSVFAERFYRTLKDLFKKPVFDKASANWIDELVYVLKKSNNSVHSSIKVTSKQASRKSYEEKVFYNTEDKRQKQKPK